MINSRAIKLLIIQRTKKFSQDLQHMYCKNEFSLGINSRH